MILCDINVLVYAFREDMDNHHTYLRWLTERMLDVEPLALTGAVTAGFVRVVTNRRIFVQPSSLDAAFRFLNTLRTARNVVQVVEGPRHFEIFERLCTKLRAHGNQVPDAQLAAIAIESGCELASADRRFAGFPNLRWRHPLDDSWSDSLV